MKMSMLVSVDVGDCGDEIILFFRGGRGGGHVVLAIMVIVLFR